jgi:hypothetical protein
MYLLQLQPDGEFSLDVFYGKQIPQYAILSHTWIANHEEVTYKDIMKGKGKGKAGYQKLRFIATQAAFDGIKYFWVDTCCIDKGSSAELQEAINSMFRWYQKSSKCYVYLADVSTEPSSGVAGERSSVPHRLWQDAFLQSRWFTRGWTLQELLAPQVVQFFSKEGNLLGDKLSLWPDIARVTSIPLDILQGSYAYLLQYDVEKRLSWAAKRVTTREEDAAYSLLGLFDLHMPLLYGEGRAKAFMRLHRERESVTVYGNLHSPGTKHIQASAPDADQLSEKVIMSAKPAQTPLKRTANEAFHDATVSEMRRIPQTSPAYAVGSETVKAQDPLENRIVRADVRVTSIDESTSEISNILPTAIEGINTDAEYTFAKTSMRTWWNNAIARHLDTRNVDTPEDYFLVAVLIIKWSDELDELSTAKEVCCLAVPSPCIFCMYASVVIALLTVPQLQEVNDLFRDRFHFRTEIVELDIRSKPQHQLNQRVTRFVESSDSPNNLLIVYYSGHGVYMDLENYLQMRASMTRGYGSDLIQDAHANWNKVEEILRSEDVEADVLAIMDTCYSSDLTQRRPIASYPAPGAVRSDQSRLFEVMSACGIDETTASPGPYSFTRALIDSLKIHLAENGDNPISTYQLVQRMNMKSRLDTSSHFWPRVPDNRHILLKPIKSAQVQRYEKFRARVGGRLTLDFDLRDRYLNREQIEFLARALGTAVGNKRLVGLRSINWVGIAPVQQSPADNVALAKRTATTWKAIVAKKREQRLASSSLDQEMSP